MVQLAEYHASALVSAKPPKRPSIKERKQKLLAFLQGMVFFSNFFFWLLLLCLHSQHGWWKLTFICLLMIEKYEPVYAKWTTERCAVCRWVEDWDYNKIIICNRYYHLRTLSKHSYSLNIWLRIQNQQMLIIDNIIRHKC